MTRSRTRSLAVLAAVGIGVALLVSSGSGGGDDPFAAPPALPDSCAVPPEARVYSDYQGCASLRYFVDLSHPEGYGTYVIERLPSWLVADLYGVDRTESPETIAKAMLERVPAFRDPLDPDEPLGLNGAPASSFLALDELGVEVDGDDIIVRVLHESGEGPFSNIRVGRMGIGIDDQDDTHVTGFLTVSGRYGAPFFVEVVFLLPEAPTANGSSPSVAVDGARVTALFPIEGEPGVKIDFHYPGPRDTQG